MTLIDFSVSIKQYNFNKILLMKTQSVLFPCLLAFALLCIQCHSHEANTTSEVSSEVSSTATKTIADKAVAAKEAIQTKTAPSVEAVKEEIKEATPTLTAIKSEVKEKATAIKEDVAVATKEVKEEVKKAVVKKEAPKPKKKKKKARSAIKFEALSYEFGKIKQGEVVKHDFKFKNTGKAPLVIKKVDVSCGCTFPSYPFIPIEPGKEGTIGITYDSKNKAGRQKPTITVVTNGSPRTLKLHLEGYVE